MEGSARQKVQGGKLITVKLRYSDRIEEIQILGDFFLYPENSLPKIEESVLGMKSTSSAEQLAKRIWDAMSAGGIELIGATPQAIAQTIIEAMRV